LKGTAKTRSVFWREHKLRIFSLFISHVADPDPVDP